MIGSPTPPFFVDSNSLDYFEDLIFGGGSNEVRSIIMSAILEGIICAPFPIHKEYIDKSDPPLIYNDKDLREIFDNTRQPELALLLGKIVEDHPKTMRKVRRRLTDPGDPWLLANASSTGGTIITEEKASPSGICNKSPSALQKIPDICAYRNLNCMNASDWLTWYGTLSP